MAEDNEADENSQIKITGHLIIRDGETGEVILNKRDVNVTSLGHTGENNARNR